MQMINVQLKKVMDTSYGITVGEGLLARLPEILKKRLQKQKVWCAFQV